MTGRRKNAAVSRAPATGLTGKNSVQQFVIPTGSRYPLEICGRHAGGRFDTDGNTVRVGQLTGLIHHFLQDYVRLLHKSVGEAAKRLCPTHGIVRCYGTFCKRAIEPKVDDFETGFAERNGPVPYCKRPRLIGKCRQLSPARMKSISAKANVCVVIRLADLLDW
jgi:hypothetical protein